MEQQGKSSRRKSKNVFNDELVTLKKSRKFLERDDITLDECKLELTSLQNSYDELLDQSKLITKVSDRLQKKINKANDELGEKNEQLQESLDALTKARVGRRATTITLIVVITLFLFTEAVLEPPIERFAENTFSDYFESAPLILALLAKGVIALSLRPIEKVVEKRLMKKEAERIEQERLSGSSK